MSINGQEPHHTAEMVSLPLSTVSCAAVCCTSAPIKKKSEHKITGTSGSRHTPSSEWFQRFGVLPPRFLRSYLVSRARQTFRSNCKPVRSVRSEGIACMCVCVRTSLAGQTNFSPPPGEKFVWPARLIFRGAIPPTGNETTPAEMWEGLLNMGVSPDAKRSGWSCPATFDR